VKKEQFIKPRVEPSERLVTWWTALVIGSLFFVAGMLIMFGLSQNADCDWIFIGGMLAFVGALGLWYAGNVPKPER